MTTSLRDRGKYRRYYGKVFLLCLLTAGLMILPFLIKGGGRFTIVDDFNVQQLPFNMLCNQAIKNGDIYWNWYTDLGSNFIGAYSFYTLGSPFFWLSLLFPASWFPYVVGPLLMLKYAVAGLTSYAYLQRFVENKNYAVIGALLYAFSGFQTINLMFNHFHDVVALFPLLLIGLEEMVEKKRPGVFALAVALNAMANFFFFVGEVVFLVLYFICRFLLQKGFFKTHWKSFARYGAESVLGVGLACVLLLPAALFTMNNPRNGSMLYGIDALIYSDRNIYINLIKSILMPAEAQAYYASVVRVDYSSLSAYLPIFGVALVLAFMRGQRTHFVSRLLKTSLLFAMIPLLNSTFYLFNNSYYARWFYMPILMMALAAVLALDRASDRDVNRGFAVTGIAVAILIAFLVFYPWNQDGSNSILHKKLFAFYVLMTVGGLFVGWFLLHFLRHKKQFISLTLAAIVLSSACLGGVSIYVLRSADHINNTDMIQVSSQLDLPPDENYRIISDISNVSMANGIPNVFTFHSTVNASIFAFYQSLGMPRVIFSYEVSPALNALLSVKYRETLAQRPDQEPYATFDTGRIKGYIYEEEPFIPLGFSYDYFITPAQLERVDASLRPYLLLRAVVLEEEDAAAYADRLKPLPAEQFENLDDAHMTADIAARQRESSTYFDRYNEGFTARIACDGAKALFFSVPYDTGWRATVNGKPVEIANADGLMAVPGEAGENEVVFTYETPGLKAGVCITALSAAALAGYTGITIFLRKRKEQKNG